MKVTLIGRRHKRQPLPVRRESRLHIHRASGGHLPCPSIPHIERPQLDSVVIVARKHHPALVRRPVWLIVVARSSCKLLRLCATEFLPPQRARHRVNKAVRIRRPRCRARPHCQLRQIHLPEIVRMGQINLFEHLFALRDTRNTAKKKQTTQSELEQEPSTARVERAPSPAAFSPTRPFYPETRTRRAQSQFSKAAPTVAAKITDLLKSTSVASDTAIPIPSTASTGPPGSRKPAVCGCFCRKAIRAAQTTA